MKVFGASMYVVIIGFALFFGNDLSAQGWRQNEMEIRVTLQNPHDAQVLHSLNLNGDIYSGYALMYVTPDELLKVKEKGLKYVIRKENLNEYYKDFWNNREEYHNYQQVIDLIDSLVTALPNLCKKEILGQSVQGRQLAAIKISDNVMIDENEPEVGFDGNIHGDEIGGGENMIRLARYLCQKYGNDPEITELVNTREIWILPMVNPDGRVSMSRYNTNGIDLNRDAGYLWDGEGSSQGFFSQPESKALRKMFYDNQFSIHLTNHSGTEVYLYPWFFRTDPCPDNAAELVLANLYKSNSGYANLETGPGTSLYPTTGSTAESTYGIMGCHGIVIEISYDKQPPASQLMYYFNINLPSMVKLIEYSGYGVEGTITDALSGEPVAAAVYVGTTLPCYTDPEVGDFHKFIVPGTYNLMVKANGYQTKVITGVQVNSLSSTVVDVALDPEEHQGIYRIVATRIPGGNQADEGATWHAIGQPDNLNYSLGKNGILVVDLQELVVDGPGNDIIVFEGDATPETFTLYAGSTMDGPWISLGTGTGTTEFDLGASTISEAQYFKFVDDGDGSSNVNDAGFDLDAMQSLNSITGVYILLEGYVIDDSNGNNNGLLDPGETADFLVTLKNIGSEDALNVIGILSSDDDYITVLTSEPQPFGNILIDESATANFTVHADGSIPPGYTSLFTLDYTGDNGLSGSKFFEILFPDYCTATTSVEDEYIANVDFGEINNSSGWQGGVANYTNITTVLEPGVAEPVTITNGNAWASDIVKIWIDWNRDMEFDVSTNEEYALTNVGGSGQTFQGNITPPGNQAPGNYRMRIRMTYSTPPTPCGSATYGEIEDYTVIIPGETLVVGFSANPTEFCEGGEVQFTDNSAGNIISWEWDFPGGEPANSSLQNPIITYSISGIYDVKLVVSTATITDSLTMQSYITVHPLPAVTFAPIEDMCVQWPAQELTEGNPPGGVYAGTGVVNGWFYPAIAGVGLHTLAYTFTDENGCINSAEQTVWVDECTGIHDPGNSISIIPNPSSGHFRILSVNPLHAANIDIFSVTGTKVFAVENIGISIEQPFEIILKDMMAGVYYMRLTGQTTSVYRLIIQ